MTTIIIEDGSPQAKKFVAYAHKLAVVKSYTPVLFSHVAKNTHMYFVYPQPFQCKQDTQNTHLNDWAGIANKQLIIHHSTQSAKKRISTEKYTYLRVSSNARATQRDNEKRN